MLWVASNHMFLLPRDISSSWKPNQCQLLLLIVRLLILAHVVSYLGRMFRINFILFQFLWPLWAATFMWLKKALEAAFSPYPHFAHWRPHWPSIAPQEKNVQQLVNEHANSSGYLFNKIHWHFRHNITTLFSEHFVCL